MRYKALPMAPNRRWEGMGWVGMDRRLVTSVLAGVLALAAGLLGAVLDRPELSLLAGAAGLTAGMATAAIASGNRRHDDELRHLQEAIDALALLHVEDARERAARDFLEEEQQQAKQVADPVSEPLPVAPDDAIDPSTGLLDERYFSVLVYQRVAAARRGLQPVSIVLFEVDGMRDADPAVQEEAAMALGEVVRATFRECDTSCRIGAAGAGTVLEHTAEAGAVWAVERVRGVLMASPLGQHLTISAAVACYPSHALSAAELLERLDQALNVARERGRDHVEVARLD